MTPGVFVTSPGTGEGKTFVTRALVAALKRSGRTPVALKPIETGVLEQPADAIAIARAAANGNLADNPAFFRARPPLAPYAATLEGAADRLDLDRLVSAIQELARLGDFTVVEGAGGLLVPLDATRSMADLARALELPLLIVAADRLGVLSNVLTCFESATLRALPVTAVVLCSHGPAPDDPSPRTNRRILAERLPVPVLSFPATPNDDQALADAALHSGLLDMLTP